MSDYGLHTRYYRCGHAITGRLEHSAAQRESYVRKCLTMDCRACKLQGQIDQLNRRYAKMGSQVAKLEDHPHWRRMSEKQQGWARLVQYRTILDAEKHARSEGEKFLRMSKRKLNTDPEQAEFLRDLASDHIVAMSLMIRDNGDPKTWLDDLRHHPWLNIYMRYMAQVRPELDS